VVCSRNALKFTYVHLLFQKIFRGLYPRTPVNMGGEGKAGEGREEREVGELRKKFRGGFAPAPPGKRKEGEGEGRGGDGLGEVVPHHFQIGSAAHVKFVK
jgi:hypothetical protein